MERYSRWHLTQFIGDKELAKRYLAEGRKYLGYVVEQREAANLGQKQWRTTNADGIKFEVSIVGEIPSLTITAPVSAGKPVLQVLEGFITRPSPNADQYLNTDLNHVLLQPIGGGFAPWFLDDAHVPVAYEDSARKYGGLFPNGISRYGNVDWRNADQSVVISWFGPSARYFGFGSNIYSSDPYVYLHGQLLLDVNDIDYALFDPVYPPGVDNELRVRGACVRGNSLYVMVHDEDMMEALVKVPLVSPQMQGRAAGLGVSMGVAFFADVTAVAADAEVLLAYESDGASSGAHPYCFNTSGSEARRIYYDFALDVAVESVVIETDLGWQHSESSETITATQTWAATREYGSGGSWTQTNWTMTNYGDYTTDLVFPNMEADTRSADHGIGHTANDDVTNTWTDNFSYPITASTITYVVEPSAQRQKLAVDFWGGQWRYAYEFIRRVDRSSELSVSFNNVHTSDDGYHYPYLVDESTGETAITSSPGDSVTNFSATFAGDESFVTRTGGIQTSFLTLVDGSTITTNLSYTITRSDETHRPNGQFEYGLSTDDTGSNTQSATYTRETSDSDYESSVEYLDLRFDIAYYQVHTETETRSMFGEVSGSSETHFDTPSTPITETTGDMTWSILGIPVVVNTSETWETRLLINGVVVDTILKATSVVGSDTYDVNMDAGSTLSWIGVVTDGVDSSASTAQIVEVPSFFTILGFDLNSIPHFPSPIPWHGCYAIMPFEDAGVGTDALTYEDESSASVTFLTPSPGIAETTFDFADASLDLSGSWLYVLGRTLADYQNPGERNAEPQFTRVSSMAGVDALLAAHPGAERLYPVGYLSKTIIAIQGP